MKKKEKLHKQVLKMTSTKEIISDRLELLYHYKKDVLPYGMIGSHSIGGLFDDLVKLNPANFSVLVETLIDMYNKELNIVNELHRNDS